MAISSLAGHVCKSKSKASRWITCIVGGKGEAPMEESTEVPVPVKVKVLIVDDHQVVVEGIKAAIDELPEFAVVGSANDGLKGMEMAKSLNPDIVIMDISMPNMSGLQATKEIKRFNKKIRVVIFTMHSDREYVVPLMKVGISAYVLKDNPLSDLILALNAVKRNNTYWSLPVKESLLEHLKDLEQEGMHSLEKLSQRELEVFRFLADGKTIKEIAEKLFISPKTVESHKYNIMEKLKVQTLAEMTKIALRKGLIKA
jgi:DNA-binding NarL/FixJ family response regulator